MRQLTPEAYQKLLQKKQSLEDQRVVIAGRIERAKEFGDLSENIEYISARVDLTMTLDELDQMDEILRNCEVVDNSNTKGKKQSVQLGSVIEVECDGMKKQFTIVSFNEVDPKNGKISNESPLGRSLLNLSVGEKVEIKIPSGKMQCKITHIS